MFLKYLDSYFIKIRTSQHKNIHTYVLNKRLEKVLCPVFRALTQCLGNTGLAWAVKHRKNSQLLGVQKRIQKVKGHYNRLLIMFTCTVCKSKSCSYYVNLWCSNYGTLGLPLVVCRAFAVTCQWSHLDLCWFFFYLTEVPSVVLLHVLLYLYLGHAGGTWAPPSGTQRDLIPTGTMWLAVIYCHLLFNLGNIWSVFSSAYTVYVCWRYLESPDFFFGEMVRGVKSCRTMLPRECSTFRKTASTPELDQRNKACRTTWYYWVNGMIEEGGAVAHTVQKLHQD